MHTLRTDSVRVPLKQWLLEVVPGSVADSRQRSAQLSSARISSARHALHFAPTRNCWDHHRENLLCYERIILFMSGLNIVKTRFSLLLPEQLQHERGIFLERSVCWECVSSGWFSGAVLLLLRLRTVVTPLSSWLSGSDFKLPVFGCFLENLTRLRAPSWGSAARFLLGFDAFGFDFSDCLTGARKVPDSRGSDTGKVWRWTLEIFSLWLFQPSPLRQVRHRLDFPSLAPFGAAFKAVGKERLGRANAISICSILAGVRGMPIILVRFAEVVSEGGL